MDLEHGEYADKEITFRKCKYTDEVHLYLGVAVITPVNNLGFKSPREGRRLRPFTYSQKILLSITDYENKIQVEILRIQKLKGGHQAGWIEYPDNTKNKLYLDDPI